MIYVRVAEKTFAVRTQKQQAMLRLMAGNYTPFLVDEPECGRTLLYSIDIDCPVTLSEAKPLKTFEYQLTDDLATLYIYEGRYVLSIFNKASGHTFTLDCPLDSADDTARYNFSSDLTLQGTPPPLHIIDHFLILALSIAGVSEDVLLIHASTIAYHNKAVMFLAESGTGKSTHTRMWLENIPGTTLLNDDAPALRISEDGTAYAYGTPWSGKTPCYKNESYPLSALVRIRRAPYNKMTRQSSIAAFGALLPSCLPTLQQHDDMLDPLCNTISKVLQTVPVYTLDCLPNPDAATVSNTTLFPENK